MPVSSSGAPWTVADVAAIRQARGMTLHEISAATKIGVAYLEAIEKLEFERLPGGLFTTSYIRQYARAIGYDEWDLLACYDAITHPPEPAPPPRRAGFLTPLVRLLAPARSR